MKKSELKQLIKEEILKVVSENNSTNEVLGFSKREKEIKLMKQKFDKAREEVKKYNPERLAFEARAMDNGKISQEKVEKTLVDRYKQELPTMAELRPKIINNPGLIQATMEKYPDTKFYIISPGSEGATTSQDYRINKERWREEQLKGLDRQEKDYMEKMGGEKFLDRY